MATADDQTPTRDAQFLFDDCCPLCRGYTGIFTSLGWTDRAAFSTADQATVDLIDFDRARHQIPLVDAATGSVFYGLDGILAVVEREQPILGRIARLKPVRTLLDGFYWIVTYNRRHIVSVAPPSHGIDCAPDYNAASVATYITASCATAGAIAVKAGLVAPVAGVAAVAGTHLALRKSGWNINQSQAVGHVASVVSLSAMVGGVVRLASGSPVAGGIAAAAVGARKLWLRRWMLDQR